MAKDSRTLSEIHFAASGRVVLYTTAFPAALNMGWGDWDAKLGGSIACFRCGRARGAVGLIGREL